MPGFAVLCDCAIVMWCIVVFVVAFVGLGIIGFSLRFEFMLFVLVNVSTIMETFFIDFLCFSVTFEDV